MSYPGIGGKLRMGTLQIFGFTVSKPLPITNTGVHDAK
jgi:hypothetical protein